MWTSISKVHPGRPHRTIQQPEITQTLQVPSSYKRLIHSLVNALTDHRDAKSAAKAEASACRLATRRIALLNRLR